MKKQKYSPMNDVKDTMKLGIGSMAGQYALGSMSSLPGMPSEAKQVSNIASSGISLANIGQMGKVGLNLTKMMGQTTSKTKKYKPW